LRRFSPVFLPVVFFFRDPSYPFPLSRPSSDFFFSRGNFFCSSRFGIFRAFFSHRWRIVEELTCFARDVLLLTGPHHPGPISPSFAGSDSTSGLLPCCLFFFPFLRSHSLLAVRQWDSRAFFHAPPRSDASLDFRVAASAFLSWHHENSFPRWILFHHRPPNAPTRSGRSFCLFFVFFFFSFLITCC